MSKATRTEITARERQIALQLSQYVEITFVDADGQTTKTKCRWFGYPKTWASFDQNQREEWWRQHCVRSYSMPLDATLTGVRIPCW